MKKSTKSWRHHGVDDVMYMRRRFVNAKIGLGSCDFYACEYQTKQPIVVKFSDIFYA